MANYLATDTELTMVADAIRSKGGTDSTLEFPEGMKDAINGLNVGADLPSPATENDILSGKNAVVNRETVTGTIPTKTDLDLSVSGATVTVPKGYYASQYTKSVASVSHPNPTVSISNSGLIKAKHSQSTGYVTGGETSKDLQLTTKAATTYNVSSSDRTIDTKTYLTGAQTIKAVTTSNIIAENIKKDVVVKVGDANDAGRIKDVTGTLFYRYNDSVGSDNLTLPINYSIPANSQKDLGTVTIHMGNDGRLKSISSSNTAILFKIAFSGNDAVITVVYNNTTSSTKTLSTGTVIPITSIISTIEWA